MHNFLKTIHISFFLAKAMIVAHNNALYDLVLLEELSVQVQLTI